MRLLAPLFAAAFASLAAPTGAVSLSEETFVRMAAADVVLLGEFHDNPSHHQIQADLVKRLSPAALVFEMLTPEQAALVTPDLRGDAARLADTLGWADSGWPDFGMYYPLFTAAPDAAIFGAAVPRETARASMEMGLTAAFGTNAEEYGLTVPLADSEQSQRERLQLEAHCNALPEDILPGMVDIQRLRDARLAETALAALMTSGGQVVVITGNGHARADWGAPRFLRRVAPNVTYFSLGQSEDGNVLAGAFDAVLDAPQPKRADPCEAFQN